MSIIRSVHFEWKSSKQRSCKSAPHLLHFCWTFIPHWTHLFWPPSMRPMKWFWPSNLTARQLAARLRIGCPISFVVRYLDISTKLYEIQVTVFDSFWHSVQLPSILKAYINRKAEQWPSPFLNANIWYRSNSSNRFTGIALLIVLLCTISALSQYIRLLAKGT